MKKKIFTFLLFLFLSSCGYEATYSLKNRIKYDFSIDELVLTGDRQINLKIKQMLNRYKTPNNKLERSFSLRISNNSEKIITAKDASGDATQFENKITLNILASESGVYKSRFKIEESFIYNNTSDTAELRNYENQIKNNLAEAAINKILNELAKTR
jgi:outer membrane lipopolysaccharide assembly protein LptE/RlpB